MDEPSVGVDPISRRELWQMVEELVDEGIGVIWSTAYLDEAEKCGHVLLLHEGKLLFEGPPKELTDRVSGRTFQVQGFEGNRRRLLTKALNADGVIDGVIQGRHLRLVLAQGTEHPSSELFNFGKERDFCSSAAAIRGCVYRHPWWRTRRSLRTCKPDEHG